jgi:cytochrome c-type biogenesis protein CcmH/NrfG
MGHERNANIDPVAKYSKDAEILEEALKEEPNNHRYLFYLAQSYFDSQQWEKAFKAYQNRVIAGGWEEEQWYSAYRMAIIASIEKRHWPEVHQLYLQAYNLRPNRAEPLWQLARIHRQERNEPRIAYLYAKTACEIKYPENDILFISSDVYHWQALDEFAAAAYYCHDFLRGYNACVELLKSPHVPETEKARIQQNTEVYKQKLMEMQMQVQQAQQQQAQDQEKQREELLKRREKQKQSKKKRQKIKR